MRFRLTFLAWRFGLILVCLFLGCGTLSVAAKDLKFEALLLWAANTEKSPNPSHKPVDAQVRRKLRELPLKWKYYFEVNRKMLTVAEGGLAKAPLSDKCSIEVADVDGKHVEVSLIGKGQPVLKRTQPLPRGEMLVLGGNAPDETGWLVVLKRVD